MSTAIKIKDDQPNQKTAPENLPSAMAALHELRLAIQGVAPRLVAHRHVHGLLHGLDVDIGKMGNLHAEAATDLLDRVGLLLEAADEGEVLPGGGLTAEQVSRLIHAAREATICLREFMPPVYPDPVSLPG